MLSWTLSALEQARPIDGMVVVSHRDDVAAVQRMVQKYRYRKVIQIIPGGASRTASVFRGLQALPPSAEWVVVHDGARPLVPSELLMETIRTAQRTQAAVAAIPVVPTIKQVRAGWVAKTLDRNHLWAIQTPQVFRRDLLESAHHRARIRRVTATDDAALVEAMGVKVRIVEGSPRNLKVTTQDDLLMAETLMKGKRGQTPFDMRVGIGFDIHRLIAGRPLVLGGRKIPAKKGLLGHSDADVLLHALCDAMLGAAGAGDLGSHFPDTDSKWKGAPSQRFIAKALRLIRARKLEISNADLMVITEEPRLGPHREAIRSSVARLLKVKESQVNVKVRTMEGLGPIGAKEAMAAYAVVLLQGCRS